MTQPLTAVVDDSSAMRLTSSQCLVPATAGLGLLASKSAAVEADAAPSLMTLPPSDSLITGTSVSLTTALGWPLASVALTLQLLAPALLLPTESVATYAM